ncbi:MAG: M81 family metallopeptidase [Celeribacter sp.]|jgi:microcystin degradation protein MlrC
MQPRAAILQLFHEASCIAPRPVTRDEFLARHHMRGPDVAAAFGNTENWMGGVLSALAARGITPQIGLCTAALPGGPLTRAGFDTLLGELLDSLNTILAQGPLSHVFLLLHGALLVEGLDDPEALIARAVRAATGPGTRIAVPLDFHANPGQGLIEAADIVIGGKLYPHTDTRARGARLVELAFAAERLTTRHVGMGLQVPMPRQETTSGPFAELAALTDQLETGAVADVTLLGGFPFSRAAHRGTSLLITAPADHDPSAIADQMRRAIASRQGALTTDVPDAQSMLPELRAALARGRVVLADVGDNPGGGGTGGDTSLLKPLIALDVAFGFGFLVAPDLVAAAETAGVGGTVDIPTPTGPIPARVDRLQPIRYRNSGAMMRGEALNGGAGAVLALGRSRVLVSSLRVQAYDTEAFRAMGVDPESLDLLAIKSIGHFRASYTPIASGGVLLTDSGGLSSPRRAPPFPDAAAPASPPHAPQT